MLSALFAILSLAVQAGAPPRVIGFGVTLSPDDIAQVSRGARPVLDGDVWLIAATPAMVCCQWSAQAYGLPSRSNQDIRRGHVAEMMAGGQARSALSGPRTWVPRQEPRTNNPIVRDYAQVALPGRAFDDVQQITDENRPFPLFGEIDDDTLVSLVRFLRSPNPNPQSARTDLPPRPWVIGSIAALADLVPLGRLGGPIGGPGIRVSLNVGGATQGVLVTVQRENGAWVIRNVGNWAQ